MIVGSKKHQGSLKVSEYLVVKSVILKTFNKIVLAFLSVESKTNILYVRMNLTGNLPLGFGRYCDKVLLEPAVFHLFERLHSQMFFQYFFHVDL